MPIPEGLYSRVIATRFRKRQAIVFGLLTFSILLTAYHLWRIYLAPLQEPSGLGVRDRLTVCAMALSTTFLIGYVTYRCPNCNSRPLGKHWPGLNPRRCPSCRTGLR